MTYGESLVNALNHATLKAAQSIREVSAEELEQAASSVSRTAVRCGDSVQIIEHKGE